RNRHPRHRGRRRRGGRPAAAAPGRARRRRRARGRSRRLRHRAGVLLADVAMATTDSAVERAYVLARERYAALGVHAAAARRRLAAVALSLHGWQGDDVGGFENTGAALGGGLAVTGNSPGKARTPDELRADVEQALSLLPGKHRLNLHASYAETGGRRVERNE